MDHKRGSIGKSRTARLDYVVQQVWGEQIAAGQVRVGGSGPGWSDTERYWVFPSAKSAQVLLPRQRKAAMRAMLDYAQLRTRRRTRLFRRAVGAASALGLPLSRDLLSVTCRDGGDATIVRQLGELLGEPDAVASLGVRTGANAKPTLELRAPDGALLGFAKIGWNPITIAAIQTEATALRDYQEAGSHPIRTPRLLASGSIGARPYLLTEGLPRDIRHVPPQWTSLTDTEAIGPGIVTGHKPLPETAHAKSLREALRETTPLTPTALAQRAQRLLDDLLAVRARVPTADIWHGDFVPWNLGRDAAGNLWLIDWETADRDVPAGLDAMHWFTNAQGSTDPAHLVDQADTAARRALPVLTNLGYQEATLPLVLAYYAVTIVGRAVALAESLGGWERLRLQPAVLGDLLEWGRTAAYPCLIRTAGGTQS